MLCVIILYFTEQTRLRLPEGDLRARTQGVASASACSHWAAGFKESEVCAANSCNSRSYKSMRSVWGNSKIDFRLKRTLSGPFRIMIRGGRGGAFWKGGKVWKRSSGVRKGGCRQRGQRRKSGRNVNRRGQTTGTGRSITETVDATLTPRRPRAPQQKQGSDGRGLQPGVGQQYRGARAAEVEAAPRTWASRASTWYCHLDIKVIGR